jgi:hypothetical protein
MLPVAVQVEACPWCVKHVNSLIGGQVEELVANALAWQAARAPT